MRSHVQWYGLVLAACALAQSSAPGQSIVRPDGSGDFMTIQGALSSGFDPEIIVYPGRYEENISITRGVIVRALEGPYFTCIDGDISDDAVTIGPGVDSQLIGFSITGGKNGIRVNSTAMIKIKNCVIHDNMESGLLATWILNEALTDLEILNSVFQDNVADGIRLVGGASAFTDRSIAFPALIQNNVILGNGGYGLQLLKSNLGSPGVIRSQELLVIDHNNAPGNGLGNWGPQIGTGVDVEIGPNNIQVNPAFVGQAGGCGPDVRLMVASAMVDSGNPGVVYRDADSSVNDIGAFGGPEAASFFESPLDGPIVRSVTLTPAVVPQGESFTVEAVVAVR